MSDKLTRTRVITIRVTVEEYDSLVAATQVKGYRTVSDLARAAMHNVMHERIAPHEVLARRLDKYVDQLTALSRKVDELIGSESNHSKSNGI